MNKTIVLVLAWVWCWTATPVLAQDTSQPVINEFGLGVGLGIAAAQCLLSGATDGPPGDDSECEASIAVTGEYRPWMTSLKIRHFRYDRVDSDRTAYGTADVHGTERDFRGVSASIGLNPKMGLFTLGLDAGIYAGSIREDKWVETNVGDDNPQSHTITNSASPSHGAFLSASVRLVPFRFACPHLQVSASENYYRLAKGPALGGKRDLFTGPTVEVSWLFM